jgi:RNA polymerase sigma factor (sigma-70 family)
VTGAELTQAEPAEACAPGAEPTEVCAPGAEPTEVCVAGAEPAEACAPGAEAAEVCAPGAEAAEVCVAGAKPAEVGVAGIAEPGAGAAGVAADDRGDLATSDSYARLDPVLRGFLRRRVPPDDVDDVIQAAFVDLWRTRARYDPGRSLEAWALAIARRRAIDHLRARPRPAVPLAGVAERPGDDGREIAARVADAAELRGALSALPRAQREAIELAYYAGLSQREIATRLRVPIGTVKARTARGLRGARRFLMSAGHDGRRRRGAA